METAASGEALRGVLGVSGGELVLVLVVILVLFGAIGMRPFLRASRKSGYGVGKSLGAGLGKPVADALTHSNQTWEFQDPPALRLRQIRKQMKNQFILWFAQGFGVGRIPFAPGTFGSLVGLVWFAVLVLSGNLCLGLGGVVGACLLYVWLFCAS